MVAGGAGELFVGGFLNLPPPCRQRPTGRAGRAQAAQDATFLPAPSGSSPSRLPWLVGLSRWLCRGLRRNKQTPSPPLPLPRGREAAPIKPQYLAAPQLYQNRFWAQTRRKPAPLQPPTLARASQYLRGEGITRLYCAHTRESHALRLQSDVFSRLCVAC